MPSELLERTTESPPNQSPNRQGLGIFMQIDGRSLQEIPSIRKIVLAFALAAALTSSALGAYFLSGQATGMGSTMQTSVTQCPMTK